MNKYNRFLLSLLLSLVLIIIFVSILKKHKINISNNETKNISSLLKNKKNVDSFIKGDNKIAKQVTLEKNDLYSGNILVFKKGTDKEKKLLFKMAVMLLL